MVAPARRLVGHRAGANCHLWAGRRCTLQRRPAALTAGLFILWPDVQQFNCYLLTESLFISLSVFSFWALVRVRGGGWRAGAVLAIFLLLTALVPPNGFVVAAAAGMAGLAALYTARRCLFWLLTSAGLLAAPLVVWWLNYQLVSFFIVETYVRGELMFATPV
ncbi:MAG: hypothetical protein ACRYG7_30590 [Janthinobacterium lividum]